MLSAGFEPAIPVSERLQTQPLDGAITGIATKYHQGDEIRDDEIGGACGTRGKYKKRRQHTFPETWRDEMTWKTLDLGEIIILKWILKAVQYDGG